MGKLKAKSQNIKIDGKANVNQGCCAEQYPWLSFKSMTRNDRYNLSKLVPGTEREQTMVGLYSKLNELSSKPWLHWVTMRKTVGLETLTYNDLHFQAAPGEVIAKDTTIYVFRFDTHLGTNKGRIMGYKNEPCAVLHIVGFDVDFSAYNHG